LWLGLVSPREVEEWDWRAGGLEEETCLQSSWREESSDRAWGCELVESAYAYVDIFFRGKLKHK
jgi:hypothetical protein